jgi:hypothetical protein
MEQLTARTIVDDLMLVKPMAKKDIEKYVKINLARSLADELVKQNLDDITVQRPFYYGYDPRNQAGTEYTMKVFVLTQDEYKEFEDLKEFRKHMQKVIK